MDIHGSIERLETAGFQLYRRIVNGSELIGALLVYPPLDLYAEVDSLIDGTLLRFNGISGNHTYNCTNENVLESAIETQMQVARETWEGAGMPPAYPDLEEWVQGHDLQTIQQIRQMQVEHGNEIECIWLTSDFGFKCLYRGAVIRVNRKLMTAIAVDGRRVEIPLNIAIALLDEMGGMEEQQIEESKELVS